MIVLGLNSVYHESSVAVLVDGELVFFAEEERFNRRKHGKESLIDNPHVLPECLLSKGLEHAGIRFSDIDLVAFSFDSAGRRRNIGVDRHAEPGGWGTREGEEKFHSLVMAVPSSLGKLIGRSIDERFRWIPHHLAHAGSAFFCSPFDEAGILIIDGIGEFDSILAARGRDREITPLFRVPYPHSLGFLWEKFCKYLGFSEYDACKVMGLSSYGTPLRFQKEFSSIARQVENGLFELDLDVLRFRSADLKPLEDLFGPARPRGGPLENRHADVAAVLQEFTANAVMALARRTATEAGSRNLCLAGGVALNCVINSLLSHDPSFERLFIPPAANDAGTALGAALQVWCGEYGRERKTNLNHAYWGPDYSASDIEETLKKRGFEYRTLEDPSAEGARLVAEGNIVGWFQGRMEMGPRALGNRSLLADPRRPDMREILNHKVKHREPFRPFAPSVLTEKAREWFELPPNALPADFMLLAPKIRSPHEKAIPAVTHVDGTSRIQTVRKDTNPRYHALITEFDRLTGVPLVLNTSFNDSEPIVMSPDDALNTFLKTRIDAVILDRFLVRRKRS